MDLCPPVTAGAVCCADHDENKSSNTNTDQQYRQTERSREAASWKLYWYRECAKTEGSTAESNHWRDRNPAPILIGQRPCHKLLAKCLCVLEKGCVHMCMLELQGCVYVCVLDQWAGDSDRLVCSKHFLVSGSESSSSYGYNWGAHAHTQPTQAFTHACTHKPSLQTLMHIHTQTQYEHIL